MLDYSGSGKFKPKQPSLIQDQQYTVVSKFEPSLIQDQNCTVVGKIKPKQSSFIQDQYCTDVGKSEPKQPSLFVSNLKDTIPMHL